MKHAQKYGCIALFMTCLLDQLIKLGIVHVWMNPPHLVPVTPFFNLVLAWNTGVSFSLFASNDVLHLWALIAVTSIVSVILFIWMMKEENTVTVIALGMIVGGAFGNIIDRLLYGAVVDFLQFYIGNFYWPAFNIADTAICIAACIIVLDGFGLWQRIRA